jgi:hypothetical protein
MTRVTCHVAIFAAVIAGCGAPIVSDVDSGSELDAGTELADAGLDTGAADSGPLDSDADGVVDSEDCDPTSPFVRRMASRPCSSGCGDGTETCTDGVWSACETPSRPCSTACGDGTETCSGGMWGGCTAPVDCLCATEGMMRGVACPLCGTQSQRCIGGVWTDQGSCLGMGECEAGTSEVIDRPTWCERRERTCTASCAWTPWTYTLGPGECEMGVREVIDRPTWCERQERVCTASCVWTPWEYTLGPGECEMDTSTCRPGPGGSRPVRYDCDSTCMETANGFCF